jgi:hypothetical protein
MCRFSATNTIRAVKSKVIRLEGQVAYMREMRNACKGLIGKITEIIPLEIPTF